MGSSVILPPAGQPATGPDRSFKSASIPNVVSFAFEKIDPPASLYIQRDDVLVVEGLSQSAGDTVTIFARLLIPLSPQPGQPDASPPPPADPRGLIGPGYVQTIVRQLAIPTARTRASLAIQLMEGYLLSLAIVGSLGTTRGSTFVRAFLNRGTFADTAPNVATTLVADYTTAFFGVGWPAGRVLSPTEGPGAFTDYNPANPVAGSDLLFTVNANLRTRFSTFTATFTASAAVANRIVSFFIGESGTGRQNYNVQDTVAVTASQVVKYSLASGATNVRGAGAGTAANPINVTLPLPSPMIQSAQQTLSSLTQSIQAGDQWSNILVTTEEWFDFV